MLEFEREGKDRNRRRGKKSIEPTLEKMTGSLQYYKVTR